MARAGLLGGCLPSTAAATTSLRKHQSPPKSLPLKGIFNQKSAVRIRCCLSPPSGYLLPRVGKLLTVAPYYLSDQVVKLFCGDNYGARYLAFAIDLVDKHQRLYKKLKPTVDKFFQLDLSNDPSYIDDCIEILLGNEDCWICTHSMVCIRRIQPQNWQKLLEGLMTTSLMIFVPGKTPRTLSNVLSFRLYCFLVRRRRAQMSRLVMISKIYCYSCLEHKVML
ncbi:unnamed protein product [Cuscuta epithymum]|uniref:Uncharacterized protein n=1 Tax=Cuscuta epithymum TaxID=186058 RepID=A0AAV0CB75_9ASTE|nr:unnamed protein product [Cuscuta epithymum]